MAGYSLRSKFQLGYRNKEDISTLPPEVLVVGSQNVLTNAAEQVGIRQGYVLDGPAGNQNTYGVDSSYDFQTPSGIRNLRKWGPNLEVRYLNPESDAVTWINLMSSLVPTNKVRFTDFWDFSTEKKRFCLFGNGSPTVYEWSGGVASLLSTSNASGIIGSVTTTPNTGATSSGGTGYVVGDVLTIAAGNSDARLTVTSVTPGGVSTITIQSAGTGYSANDIISISGAGVQHAFAKVTTVNGSGGVTAISLLTAGTGYYVASAVTTTDITTGGTGLTLNVTAVGNTITGWTLTVNGSGYSAADRVATSGGTGTAATVQINTVATNSITVSGTETLAQLGFYNVTNNLGKFQLLINGTVYTYTSSTANGGFTFVGINVDPTIQGFTVGDAIIQPVFTGATSGSNASFLPAGFNIDLITTLSNQVWYGDTKNNSVYASHTNDYTTVAFSSPRTPGEGLLVTLDAPPIGFKPQTNQGGSGNGNTMYIAAGNNQWYAIGFQLSSDLVNESIEIFRLKTTALQGAQGQEMISDFKNTIAFVSNEPQLNEFGIQANFFAEPQMVNISDPIKYDMDAYDFTGGAVDYDNYYLYILIPANGVMRLFNLAKKYWEAPQLIPISRIYRVEGALYGHSALTNESYQLFTGYNDNGNPINAVAAFPYVASVPDVAEPDDPKMFDRIYTEGYIAGNTELLCTINYDFGGFSGTYSVLINGQPAIGGSPNPIIFNRVTDGSLGQNTLGSQPIGSILNLGSQPNIPKFRVINTMPKHPFFESQIVYSSNDVDLQWTLLRFGPLVQKSTTGPTSITQ